MSDNDRSIKDCEIRVRKRSSLVWQYFEKLSETRVKCRICQHEQKYLGNTANALRHLKVKHNIDARPIGLTDPENVKRMKALSCNALLVERTVIKSAGDEGSLDYQMFEDVERQSASKRHQDNLSDVMHNYDDIRAQIDPYATADDIADYMESDDSYQPVLSPPPTAYKQESTSTGGKRKGFSILENRLLAETEYFRQKADYYRIQKYLSALQAKKVKYDLDQLYQKQN